MSVPEQTKNAIKEMIKIDKAIDELSTALKKYKKRKDDLQAIIEKDMRTFEIKQINLPGGEKLQTYTRKSRASCSKDWISNRLQTYCNERSLNYDEIFDYIYNPKHRPQVEKQSIKKVKPRKIKK